MLLAIGAVLSGTLMAAAVAINGYGNVETTLATITGQSLPAMNRAMRVAQHAERLVALAPALEAARDEAGHREVSDRLVAGQRSFEEQLGGTAASHGRRRDGRRTGAGARRPRRCSAT